MTDERHVGQRDGPLGLRLLGAALPRSQRTDDGRGGPCIGVARIGVGHVIVLGARVGLLGRGRATAASTTAAAATAAAAAAAAAATAATAAAGNLVRRRVRRLPRRPTRSGVVI